MMRRKSVIPNQLLKNNTHRSLQHKFQSTLVSAPSNLEIGLSQYAIKSLGRNTTLENYCKSNIGDLKSFKHNQLGTSKPVIE